MPDWNGLSAAMANASLPFLRQALLRRDRSHGNPIKEWDIAHPDIGATNCLMDETFSYQVPQAVKSRLEKAEIRAAKAEVRTEQAKTRIEAAETRAEQAETRTEQAETRVEAAETRAEEAETAIGIMVQENAAPPLSEPSPADALDHRALGCLTGRQREVLQLIAKGENTKQIAGTLKISPKTVEYHRAKVMSVLDVHDIPGLVRFALRVGLITPEG